MLLGQPGHPHSAGQAFGPEFSTKFTPQLSPPAPNHPAELPTGLTRWENPLSPPCLPLYTTRCVLLRLYDPFKGLRAQAGPDAKLI